MNLDRILDKAIPETRVIAVIGKDKQDHTKVLFKGTALDAWRARKNKLKRYMYADIVDIAPATIKFEDGTKQAGLKIIIFCEYGFGE